MALLALTAAPASAEARDDGGNPPIVVTGFPTPDIFGTVAIAASLSRYAADWDRAKRPAHGNPAMLRLVAPARGLSRDGQIAYVQAAVHRQIRWMSDATEWGRHEYWASAAETLAHGAGDMEDRAIVKMHALRALGFKPADLVLTLGRDKVGGQIVILLVRVEKGRLLTLDDLGGEPIEIERREGFEPHLSFSNGRSWLHGRRIMPGSQLATAVASTAAAR